MTAPQFPYVTGLVWRDRGSVAGEPAVTAVSPGLVSRPDSFKASMADSPGSSTRTPMVSQHATSTWTAGSVQAHLPAWSAAAATPAPTSHPSHQATTHPASSGLRARTPSHAKSHSHKHPNVTASAPATPLSASPHTPTAARPSDPPHPLPFPPPRSAHQPRTFDGTQPPRPYPLFTHSRSYNAGGLTPLVSQHHEQPGPEWFHAAGPGPGSFLQLPQQAAVARSASERRIQRLLHKIDSVCSIRSTSSNRSSSSGASLSHGAGTGASRSSSARRRDHVAADQGEGAEAGAPATVAASTVGTRTSFPGSSLTLARGLQPCGEGQAGGASKLSDAPLLDRQRRLSAPDQVLRDVDGGGAGGALYAQAMGGVVGRVTTASRQEADGRRGASADGTGAPDCVFTGPVRGIGSSSSSGGGSSKSSSLNGSRSLAVVGEHAPAGSEAAAGQQPTGLAPAVGGGSCSGSQCGSDPDPDSDGLGERELSVRQLVRPEAAASHSGGGHTDAHSEGDGGGHRLHEAEGPDAGRIRAAGQVLTAGQGPGAVAPVVGPSGVGRDPAVRGADDLHGLETLGGRGRSNGGRSHCESPAPLAAVDGEGLAMHAHLHVARAAGGAATPTPLGATGGEDRQGEEVHRRAEGDGQAGKEGEEEEQEEQGGRQHSANAQMQREDGGGGTQAAAPWRLSSSEHGQLLPGDGLAQLAHPLPSAPAPANTPMPTPLRGGPSRVASGRAGRFLDATSFPSHSLLALSSDLSAQIEAALQHTPGHRPPSNHGHAKTPAATPADGAAGAAVHPHASSGALAVLQEAAQLVAQIDQDLRAGAAAARRRTSCYPRPSPMHPHANGRQALLAAGAAPTAAAVVPAKEAPGLRGQLAAGPHRRVSTPPLAGLAAEGLGPLQRRGSHQALHGLPHGGESSSCSSRASSVGDNDGPEDLQGLPLSAQYTTALVPAPAHLVAEARGRSTEALLADGGVQPQLSAAAAAGVTGGAVPGSPAGSDSGSTLSSIMRHLEEHLGPLGAGPAGAAGEGPGSEPGGGLDASGTTAASQLGSHHQGHQQQRSPGPHQPPLGPVARHTPHSLSLADLGPPSAAAAGAGARVSTTAPALARGLAVGPVVGDALIIGTAPGSRALSGRALLSRTSRGTPSTEAALHVSEPSEVGPGARSGLGGASGAPVGGTTGGGTRGGGSFRAFAGLSQQQQQQQTQRDDGGVQQHAGGEAVGAVGGDGLLVDVEGLKRDLERLLGGAGLR